MGGRIDHLDVQRRGFAEAAFFLGDTLGRQGEHHQHRLVAVAHEEPSQRRAVRRHQVVAKLLDGGERPGCTFRRTFRRTFGRGRRRGIRPCAEYRVEPLRERGPARRQGDLREVAALIEHALGECALGVQQPQHAMLDGVLAHQVDDGDRAGLMLAPGAGNALLQTGRVPGQVHVDDGIGHLKVEPHAAGFRRQEQPAFGVCAESADLGPALRLRHAAGVPGELDAGAGRVLAHQLQHPHPFGEDDDLALRIVEKVGQQPLDLLHLGTVPVLVAEDPGRVADHAHAGEELLEPVELVLGERSFRGERGEALHVEVVVLVGPGLGIGHRHEEGLDGPARKLALHVLLAPPEHHRGDPSRELVQVPEAGGVALRVQLVELPVEAEQRPQEIGVQELDDRVDLVDAVLRISVRPRHSRRLISPSSVEIHPRNVGGRSSCRRQPPEAAFLRGLFMWHSVARRGGVRS